MKIEPAAWLALALAIAGCSPAARGPRPIVAGSPCAACGMPIQDLRYACEDLRATSYRFYDSIECLLHARPRADRAWLADHDTRTLHSAESLWVVRGDLPSPMGGGFAAFLDPGVAREIAAARNGRVDRWNAFAAAGDSARPEERP